MKIAIFGNKYQKSEQIQHIFDILLANSVEIYLHQPFRDYLESAFGLQYNVEGIIADNDFDVDIALSIGGDGTFLQTASIIGKRNIPLLGINTGRLGFLADVTDVDLDKVLADLMTCQYRLEERSQLHLSTVDSEQTFDGYPYALNEVAILKQDTAAMLTIHAYINDEYLTTYESDGLIIATPTGSTAYSLSVGGPIMTPTTASFILIAIAPHSLNARPLVVDDDSIITLEVESRSDNFLISLDGRSNTLAKGCRLSIQKASHSLKVVKRTGHTFYGTLRNKLKWGIDPRQQ